MGAYVLACIGIFFDLIDVIQIFVSPDSVHCKSIDNIISAIVKLIAFGLIVGIGTHTLLSNLQKALCYNVDGTKLLASAETHYYIYSVLQCLSAVLAIVMAPFSALYGGKLHGTAYVK